MCISRHKAFLASPPKAIQSDVVCCTEHFGSVKMDLRPFLHWATKRDLVHRVVVGACVSLRCCLG